MGEQHLCLGPRANFAHPLPRARGRGAGAGGVYRSLAALALCPLPQVREIKFVAMPASHLDSNLDPDCLKAFSLAEDGTWLVADIKARPSYAENVEKNPMAAMMHGVSVMVCMSSSVSAKGGAGFTRFSPIDLGHAVNAFYVVRP